METARKSYSLFLSKLQEPGMQVAISAAMGISESTVSRIKTEQAEQFFKLLAHLGLKIVESDWVCVNEITHNAMAHIVSRAMSDPDMAKKILRQE